MRGNSCTHGCALVAAAFALAIGAPGCHGPASSPPPSATPPAPSRSSSQPAPSVSNEGGPLILPDPQLTPGATLAVSSDDLCVPGYTKLVRNVPVEVKRQVYAEYGITDHQPGEYEVDHLISLELGGSNSIKNVWPESYETQPWNAHVKDDLENELHRLVCSGALDLKTAQHDIAADWIGAYKQYFHTDQPLATPHASRRRRREEGGANTSPGESSAGTAVPAEAPSNPDTSAGPAAGRAPRVWVNTRSGKYFLPGSRYYGHTKQGEFMSEAEARQLGYSAAGGD